MDDRLAFPVGYHPFNKDRSINFQLNRWHSLGLLPLELVRSAGQDIGGYDDWRPVLETQADRSMEEGNLMVAAFFYRAAQFFVPPQQEDNERLYRRFREVFWQAAGDTGPERHDVPFGESILPAMRLAARPQAASTDGQVRGTIVLHGGFDSFVEEFYTIMMWFAERGYDVIAFEGPGQGDARRAHGLVLDHRWELPVAAVHDHFGVDDTTLFGLSMGGYLCLRAAAFESRIGRVVASSVPFDYAQFASSLARPLVKLFFTKLRGFTNRQAIKRMEKDAFYYWYMSNLMFMTGTDQPIDGLDHVMAMNEQELHSSDIRQDVLVLTGKNDHTVPLKMHAKQVAALTGARSVTARVFTAEEHADQHCQVGNVGLALQTTHEWIRGRTE